MRRTRSCSLNPVSPSFPSNRFPESNLNGVRLPNNRFAENLWRKCPSAADAKKHLLLRGAGYSLLAVGAVGKAQSVDRLFHERCLFIRVHIIEKTKAIKKNKDKK
jgi:hypothetical protein